MLPPRIGHPLQILFSDLVDLTVAPANDFVNYSLNALINGGTTTVRSLDKNGDGIQTTQETGPDSYEGKLADSEKPNPKIAKNPQGRDLVKIRHITPCNFSVRDWGACKRTKESISNSTAFTMKHPSKDFQ